MAKVKRIDIPYDPITGEILHNNQLPSHWQQVNLPNGQITSQQVPDPQYVGLSIDWRPNDPFFATLKLKKITQTYSGSAIIHFINEQTGISVCMYAAEFNDVIDRFIDAGRLEGYWRFKVKGNNYSLVGV